MTGRDPHPARDEAQRVGELFGDVFVRFAGGQVAPMLEVAANHGWNPRHLVRTFTKLVRDEADRLEAFADAVYAHCPEPDVPMMRPTATDVPVAQRRA